MTSWINPSELERPRHHVAWQLYRGRDSIFDFSDTIGPLESGRRGSRIFCWVLLVAGVISLVVGLGRRRAHA